MVILDTQYTTAMGSIMEQQLHSAVWKYDNDLLSVTENNHKSSLPFCMTQTKSMKYLSFLTWDNNLAASLQVAGGCIGR